MAGTNQPGRHTKRSRVSDAAAEKPSRTNDERVKRRRFSEHNDSHGVQAVKPQGTGGENGETKTVPMAPWSFSRPVGGRYSNLDPILTSDEAYLFVGLEAAVQIFATSNSRLSRTLQMEAGQKVVGYKLCPRDQEHVYIFTSSGSVTKWHWPSGKRITGWQTSCTVFAVDIASIESADQPTVLSFSIAAHREDRKRQILVHTLGDKKLQGTVALQTNERINHIKVAHSGRVIVASDGQHLFMGTITTAKLQNLESAQYEWREAILPVNATCSHLRESAATARSATLGLESVDIVLGESGGSILIYEDVLNTLFAKEKGRDAEKKPSPRKLHWHRGPVNAVQWSKDGNYIISGGHESVMVLWQLDTGRKQFLPHLSSPICNIFVSPSGNSYVVKLADNSVMILSVRELQPFTSITGLQLSPEMGSRMDPTASKTPRSVVAVLHPQHPEKLLVAVPASHHPTQRGSQPANSAVLQTYDIRSNCHVSRQALARTNTTTLSVSPEGSPIVSPDVRQLGIAQDGKWLATVDTWTPHAQDVSPLAASVSGLDPAVSLRMEVFLKFWKWNASAGAWELATRIDGPHFIDNHHSAVLGLESRPCAHEFATLGTDALLRFWCPTARHRSGLKAKDRPELQQDTWKCRGFVDLNGCIGDSERASLDAACMSFSEDGSVLAVCLAAATAANYGLVLLIDVQNCTVHYRRTGVFMGDPCSTRFLGKHLVVGSSRSVAVWNTVDDVVTLVQSEESVGPSDTEKSQLLAVNSRTTSFAVATRGADSGSSTSSKKRRKNRFHIRIYELPSLQLAFQESVRERPLALLSDAYSGEYIVVDAGANVLRVGCSDKKPQSSPQSPEMSDHLHSGLANLFSRGSERVPTQTVDNDPSLQSSRSLTSVFGDTPSFSLPALSVLFRNVVQSLGAS